MYWQKLNVEHLYALKQSKLICVFFCLFPHHRTQSKRSSNYVESNQHQNKQTKNYKRWRKKKSTPRRTFTFEYLHNYCSFTHTHIQSTYASFAWLLETYSQIPFEEKSHLFLIRTDGLERKFGAITIPNCAFCSVFEWYIYWGLNI